MSASSKAIRSAVADGGRRRRKRKLTEWERAGGVFCPACGDETVRILRGVCPSCFRAQEEGRVEKAGKKAQKRYYWDLLQRGEITLAEMRKGTRR